MWTDRCVDRQMCSPDDSEMQLTGKAQPLSAGRAACWVSWEPEEGVRVMGPESLQVQRPWLEGSCGAGGAFLDPAPNHGASILKAPPPPPPGSSAEAVVGGLRAGPTESSDDGGPAARGDGPSSERAAWRP